MPPHPVRTRRVHYLPGFDPRGARHYHHLYQSQSALQTQHNHALFKVSPRSPINPHFHHWEIQAIWKNEAVDTDYHFLGWDDIVRENWSDAQLRVLVEAIPAYFHFAAASGFQRVRSHSKNAFLTGTLPVAYYAAALTLAPLLGLSCSKALPELPLIHPAILAGLLTLASSRAALSLGSVLGLNWLLRTYTFIHRWHTNKLPSVAERVDSMARHILACHQSQPTDETLIVGHSVGSLLAVSVAARLQTLLAESTTPPPQQLHLLTLGQCIPLLSFLPSATAFHRDLQTVSDSNHLPWTDISSPPDPLCFFQQNPLTASNVPNARADRVRCLNARIFPMFTKQTYQKIRWNKIRLHFQYLMASELPSPYDFFRITAGPSPLSALTLTP